MVNMNLRHPSAPGSRNQRAKCDARSALVKIFRKARPRTTRQAKVDMNSTIIATQTSRHGEAEFEPARAMTRSIGVNTNPAFERADQEGETMVRI